MKSRVSLYAACAALAAGAAGCSLDQFRKDPVRPASPEATCEGQAMIENAEDRNDQVLLRGGRSGYIYTFLDKAGSTITPPESSFRMEKGGANGSKFAANFKGHVGTGAIVFSGMGVNFVDPKDKYDASKYAGIAFFAKRGESSTGKVRLKVPDMNTDPDGAVCTECFNDFGGELNLTTDWKKYIFPFKKMSQEPDWGAPRKPHIVPSTIYGVQFQVKVPNANYDIWVDDLQFLCQ